MSDVENDAGSARGEGEIEPGDGPGKDVWFDIGLGHHPQIGHSLHQRLEEQAESTRARLAPRQKWVPCPNDG